MNNVSLLPPEIKLYRQSRQKMKFYSFILIIGFMVLLLIYFSLIFANIQARSELTVLRNEKIILENEISILKKYEQMQEQVIYLNRTFEKIMERVPDWEGVLLDIGFSIPDGVWLTDITATHSTTSESIGGDLLIRGTGVNNLLVAAWLEEIRVMSFVNNANINFVSKRIVDNHEVIQFEIKVAVKPGENYSPFLKGGKN
ncbi:PilN domain-containing protein [Desulfitibacter alkalitolerans]|uniref:PilN domain-containing protein n=1 Tax=Desulfitibacter alkalitolerans TaxID=264641 RepID=UPI0004822144|nr:PilN domain-containing protein [Desulfitibacter alkalitolerans]